MKNCKKTLYMWQSISMCRCVHPSIKTRKNISKRIKLWSLMQADCGIFSHLKVNDHNSFFKSFNYSITCTVVYKTAIWVSAHVDINIKASRSSSSTLDFNWGIAEIRMKISVSDFIFSFLSCISFFNHFLQSIEAFHQRAMCLR